MTVARVHAYTHLLWNRAGQTHARAWKIQQGRYPGRATNADF